MIERVEPIEKESAAWLRATFAANPYALNNPSFLKAHQQQHLEQFLQRGFPTRKEELWKYTDTSFLEKSQFHWADTAPFLLAAQSELRQLIAARAQDKTVVVFRNGHFSPALSLLSDLPEGVILANLQQSLQTHASLIKPYLLRDFDAEGQPFASLNAAMLADGLFLYVPRGIRLEKPIHILSIANGNDGFMMHPRHLIILESDSAVTLTEEYLACNADNYLTNVTTDIFVGCDARLNYYKLLNEASAATHFASIFIHQKQNSLVNACSFALGGKFSRNDLKVSLAEKGATCRVNGFYGLDSDKQLIDHHLLINHAAPYTKSEMDFRGVLANQSRAVFNGKVIVQPKAEKSQAEQVNRNVLLSTLAEVNTKPELEIYNDDVQCRHGATVGQLDEDILYYLCARGIDRQTATTMLLQGFVAAALSAVTDKEVLDSMQQQWESRLAQ